MHTFTMPTLGADMEAGTLVAWRKQPGDTVSRGDVIAEVDTDKGVIDVEVFAEGTLDEILIEPGTRVPVGTPLATIRELAEGGAGSGVSPESPRAAPMPSPGPEKPSPTPPSPSSPAAAPSDRLDRMRHAIAAAMTRSKREIPHYYLATTIDLQRVRVWLAGENESRPPERRLLPGVLLLKAAAMALRKVPELNAVWEDDAVKPRSEIHVGLTISLRTGGIVILAIHDTPSRGLDDLMATVRDLTERARAGRIKSSELADSTITVTSLGDRGVEEVLGVIYPPQVALVGFGRILERPWAADGGLFVRPVVRATLSADHRASDGHRGGLYLDALAELLQEPEKL
jgi:pyruvate dehydrogenase E2 component (dihydrolipoamide acetyltransferase)